MKEMEAEHKQKLDASEEQAKQSNQKLTDIVFAHQAQVDTL
jgi:hypothetical protein